MYSNKETEVKTIGLCKEETTRKDLSNTGCYKQEEGVCGK